MEQTASTRASSARSPLRLVTADDLKRARLSRSTVVIGQHSVSLIPPVSTATGPPPEYELETTSLWSFPDRGRWATHEGSYRGNWSPYVPRNLIVRYTLPGELVVDPMMGSGTSVVEAALLGRRAIGVDINPDAALVAQSRLHPLTSRIPLADVHTYVGDCRDLTGIDAGSAALVLLHPPYANAIIYSSLSSGLDLSRQDLPAFLRSMDDVASEARRILRPGGRCALLMGDLRAHRRQVLLGHEVLQRFLGAGFRLEENIVKAQHATRGSARWRGRQDFYLLAHENLYILS